MTVGDGERKQLAVHCLIGVVTAGVLAGCYAATNDADLARTFAEGKQSFERLVEMFRVDRNVMSVGPHWTDPEEILPEPRLREYRRLLKDLELESVHRYQAAEGQIALPIQRPIWNQVTKGFFYSEAAVSPIYETLDSLPADHDSREVAYRRLKGNWYLYSRRND